MTEKFSIGAPDDAYLQDQGNTSAAATEAARRVLRATRHVRQHEAADAWREYLRQRSGREIDEEKVLIETSNDISLRGSQWQTGTDLDAVAKWHSVFHDPECLTVLAHR